MNPVKATALYTNVCRCALLCETHTGSGTDLHRLLPSFRQSVCCLVCGNLLQDPIAPINSSCQHYVCKGCKGHGMVVMPPCGWCQDNGQFAENRQLCILVECYRKLCEFIARSPSLARHVSGCPEVLAALQESPDSDPDEVEEEEGTCQPARANGLTICNRLCQEKRAGTETSFAVTLVCEEHPVDVCGHDEGVNPAGAPLLISVEEVLQDLDGPPRQHRKRSRSEGDGEKVLPLPIGPIVHRECPEGETPPLATVANGTPPKLSKAPGSPARKSGCKAKSRVSKWRDGVKDPRTSPLPPARLAPRKPVAKKGCKCGRATQNPSVLTCRGQRCPCYSGRKACLDCVCRGCQNSYMANGEKKLEAFAVPEKALEQTRLTLGIGVTGTAPNGTVPPVTANALTRSWT